jgi:hypothetical protein
MMRLLRLRLLRLLSLFSFFVRQIYMIKDNFGLNNGYCFKLVV